MAQLDYTHATIKNSPVTLGLGAQERDGGNVQFGLYAPGTHKVTLIGDFNN